MFKVYNKYHGLAPKYYIICLYTIINTHRNCIFRKHVNECLCGNILSNTLCHGIFTKVKMKIHPLYTKNYYILG